MKTRRAAPVEQTSADILTEQIERLKDLFPEAVTEGKVDFEKLKATLGEIVDARPDRYSFAWAGKRDAIRLLQVPSRATLKPCSEESVDWETTKNVFIEGENLEVLKLLYKSYAGRVKMIYIDPPYNTGNDFIYPDNFADPLDTYLKLTGQKDAEGNLLTSNPETSGRYHSVWLSMMYPRLFVARQLLREDGVICVSTDDHEVGNLRAAMNEIFGEENLIGQITILSNPRGRQSERFLATVHEYLLVFAKNALECVISGMSLTEEQLNAYKYEDENGRRYRLLGLRQRGAASRREDRPLMFYPLYVDPATGGVCVEQTDRFKIKVLPRKSTGEDSRWGWSKEKVAKNLHRIEARLVSTRDEWDVFFRDYLESPEGQRRTRKFRTLWDDKAVNYQNGTSEIKVLFGSAVIEYPKPTGLLAKVVQMCDDPDGVFLDFFAGSCATADAILRLNRSDGSNRQVMVVQLPEPTPNDSVARKEGYATIADIGKERIRRVIKKLKGEARGQEELFKDRETPEDLGFRVFKLAESNYRQWRGVEDKDGEKYAEEMYLFTDPLLPGWTPEDVVWEVALKEGYSLPSTVEELKEVKGNRVWRVTDADRGQSFHVCLDDKIKDGTVKALKLRKEDLFVCRDAALTDEQAANLALTCKLKTI